MVDPNRAFIDECVTIFLKCSEATTHEVKKDTRTTEEERSAFKLSAQQVMRNARLFAVRDTIWTGLHDASQRFVAEDIVGVKGTSDGFILDELTQKVWDFYMSDTAYTWPFPQPLPFASCFFCYGGFLSLTGRKLFTRMGKIAEEYGDYRLLGNLLYNDGSKTLAYDVILNATSFHTGVGSETIAFHRIYNDGRWESPASLDPWILSSLVFNINEHKSIIDESKATLTHRLARKKISKRARCNIQLPSPFYVVNLTDELISKQHTGTNKMVEWSHRWDVRGHECVRYQHGRMPIDPKVAVDLRKKDYEIYEGRPLSADDAGRLLKRGFVTKADEWLAIKTWWQNPCIKGPADKPYVPATRV